MAETTIFSKIINGEIPCEKLHEDEICIAFNDIASQAPVHFLVIPKKPLVSLCECLEEDKDLLGHLLLIGKNIAKSKKLKRNQLLDLKARQKLTSQQNIEHLEHELTIQEESGFLGPGSYLGQYLTRNA